jgi:hypothetical protein
MKNMKEKFIDLKYELIENNFDDKTILLGIDILLEVLADKEFVKNKHSEKHIEYIGVSILRYIIG